MAKEELENNKIDLLAQLLSPNDTQRQSHKTRREEFELVDFEKTEKLIKKLIDSRPIPPDGLFANTAPLSKSTLG